MGAETICEALLQKVITTFSLPSGLIKDAVASLTGKLLNLLCGALNIDMKLVFLTMGLCTERHTFRSCEFF